jgi:hypothetical protein
MKKNTEPAKYEVGQKGVILPLFSRKDSTHLMYRICNLQVYINDGILGYVINIPLEGTIKGKGKKVKLSLCFN